MNKREAAIVTAFTGKLCGSFSDFHAYAEEIMSRPIWTHEFGSKELSEELKQASRKDFISLSENLE